MLKIKDIPVLSIVALSAACSTSTPGPATTAFTGATVWDGTGPVAMANATMLVQEGRVVSVESGGEVPDGADVVSLEGQFVTPGFVNAHGHVTGLWADETITDEVARARGDLELFARYGVTTVNSLGDGEAVITARDAATPMDARARVFAAGEVITESDPQAAGLVARERVDAGVDWLKLRVDDNLRTSTKMPWEAVQEVLDVSNERGVPLATHLFYLDDAKRLLEMGTDMVAHSVRDTDVDQAFIDQIIESGVCYVPTLTREVSTFVYADRPDFFDDEFFQRHAHPGQVERVSDPDFMQRTRMNPIAAGYRVALEQALENVKVLVDAGVPVAMGTDAGPAGRFPGYFEHLEMWMMADAGIDPVDVLHSATSVAAECLAQDDIGTLESGKWADFVVFDENPLVDIRATRSLEAVYIAGSLVR